ncbi:hypothetical protein KAJ27_16620 [bacterium]|nr:hypothetical protein [bacterium]
MDIKREKIIDTYVFLRDNLYFCQPDFNIDGVEFNSTLMMSLLTGITGKNALVYGEYGMGKTTACENIISILYGLPLEVVLSASIKGHPEQTEEKMIARPDLGKLNQGIEENKWQHSIFVGPKLIDEFNRLPSGKQNILLDGIDRGYWKYLNEFISYDTDYPMYATCNWKDSGNSDLIPPVLDRFDVAIESKYMGIVNSRKLRTRGMKNPLKNKKMAAKFFELFNKSSGDVLGAINDSEVLCEEFRDHMESKTGLKMLRTNEIDTIRDEIDELAVSEEANLFLDLFLSEVTTCPLYGCKRSGESCPKGCHYSSYACGKVKNGLSIRAENSIVLYAKALAWLLGQDEAGLEHIKAVTPYVIWHRINFNKTYAKDFANDERSEPLKLYITKQMVGAIVKNFTNLKKDQKNVIFLYTRKKDRKKADEACMKMDHPVFKQYMVNLV